MIAAWRFVFFADNLGAESTFAALPKWIRLSGCDGCGTVRLTTRVTYEYRQVVDPEDVPASSHRAGDADLDRLLEMLLFSRSYFYRRVDRLSFGERHSTRVSSEILINLPKRAEGDQPPTVLLSVGLVSKDRLPDLAVTIDGHDAAPLRNGEIVTNPVNNTDPTGLVCFAGKNPNGSCRGSGAAQRVVDVAVAVKNAPITGVTATVNVVTGGDCRTGGHLTVICEGGVLSDLGDTGFTTGNTVNVSTGYVSFFNDHPEILEHEWRHSRQWAVLGPSFLSLYVANYGLSELLSGGQCWNVFEWEAGFDDGHYGCNGFGNCG